MKPAFALLITLATPAFAAPVNYTIDANHTFPLLKFSSAKRMEGHQKVFSKQDSNS